MIETDVPPPRGTSPDAPAVAGRPWWALIVAVIALAGIAGLLVRAPATQDPHAAAEEMVAVAPAGTIDIAGLPSELQALYHAAADDEEAFTAVRCYCGCEQMLGHRDLRTCFVRPDGDWERHAVGCAVCQNEAREVVAARARGTPLDRIVADIDATYGQITSPQEST